MYSATWSNFNNLLAPKTLSVTVGMEDGARRCSRSHSLTACPGATVYMPSEAVQDNPVYTNKIDCFSFGVLVVQILTRQFPNLSDRHVHVPVQARNTDTPPTYTCGDCARN